MKVNKKLLPIKSHFFLFNAGTAPLVPYLSTYARQLGFTSSTVGLIYTVLPICGLVAKPLFGAIADRFKWQKVLLIIFQIVTALSFLAIYFIPESHNAVSIQLGCKKNKTIVQGCFQSEDLIDNCLVTRLKSDVSNTACKFDCNVRDLYNTLCDEWEMTQYCSEGYYLNREKSNSLINTEFKILSSDISGSNNGRVYESNNTLRYIPEYLTLSGIITHMSVLVENQCISLDFEESNDILRKCKDLQAAAALHLPSCLLSCNTSEIQQLFETISDGRNENDNQFTSQFWSFFILMIISWVGQAVIVSVADAICFNVLGKKPQHYGKQRLWGSVGWGLVSLLTGTLIDTFSDGPNKNYIAAFVLMFIFMFGDIVASCFIDNKTANTSTNILTDVGSLLKSLPTFVFLLWTIAVGLGTGLLWQFLFWHIEDVAGLTCEGSTYVKTLQGLVSAIQSFCGEIPFMFLSGRILKKLGHENMMGVVLFGFGVRFILYSILTNPWWILPIEILQGVTFGMFYPTMTSYASIVAPPGTETTVQGLTGAVFEGVGTSLGSFIGGRLYEVYGGWNTFRWYGYGAFVCCVFHFIIQYLLPKHKNNRKKNEDKTEEKKCDVKKEAVSTTELCT